MRFHQSQECSISREEESLRFRCNWQAIDGAVETSSWKQFEISLSRIEKLGKQIVYLQYRRYARKTYSSLAFLIRNWIIPWTRIQENRRDESFLLFPLETSQSTPPKLHFRNFGEFSTRKSANFLSFFGLFFISATESRKLALYLFLVIKCVKIHEKLNSTVS